MWAFFLADDLSFSLMTREASRFPYWVITGNQSKKLTSSECPNELNCDCCFGTQGRSCSAKRAHLQVHCLFELCPGRLLVQVKSRICFGCCNWRYDPVRSVWAARRAPRLCEQANSTEPETVESVGRDGTRFWSEENEWDQAKAKDARFGHFARLVSAQ